MRPLFFAAGLFMAANSTNADVIGQVGPQGVPLITLTNGCVYAPDHNGQPNAWSLLYVQAGATAHCALTIYGQPDTPPAQTVPVKATPAPLPAPIPVTAPALAPVQAVAAADPVVQRPVETVARSNIFTRLFSRGSRASTAPGYVVGVYR